MVMAEMKQRSLEEVKDLSVEEAVEIMRQAGVVGAGGGGFPTYFKYMKPQPHLLVNATESEPGYWGDKLVHKEHLEEFLQLFEAMNAIFGFEQISLCVHEKDREWFADYAEHAGDGEGIDLKVYEVPIGASFAEVVGMAGLDVENSGHLSLLDGGPYLHDMGIKEIGNGDGYVRRMTNALFLIPKDRQGKEYADTKTDPPEEGIVSLVGKISGVHIPLGGGLLKPATKLVAEDDEVEYEQKIGEPADEGFSIGVWASMGGKISSIENNIVAIAEGAIPQEEAEAEAQASGAGGAPPRGEAEPFQEAEAETRR